MKAVTVDMNKDQAKALEESIQHHKENYQKAMRGELIFDDISGINCALCKLNSKKISAGDCRNCIIKIKTGTRCINTPWIKILDAIETNNQPAAASAELKEISFLESLRD